MCKSLAILLTAGLYLGLTPLPVFALSDCVNGLRDALIAGGYSGDTDCTSVKTDTRKIVAESIGSFPFTVYDLIYKTMPQGFGVAHGGERLLFFKDDKYVGQYDLSPPPFSVPTIEGDDIVLEGLPKSEGNVIHLEKNKLPSKVWIGGFVVELAK